jgi:CRP-like cAMP-binding protein
MIDHLLQSIQRVIALNDDEINVVQSLFKAKAYQKGEFFLADGQVCKHAGFIEKGLIRYYINDDGEEKTYEFGKENDFVCNYESFLTQAPSTKIIQALEDCVIWQISFPDLQVFYQSVAGGERFGRIVIEQVFIQLLSALGSLYTDTPEQRYLKLLNEHPDLQQRVSQYHIASYVGVKPQSLSRIRKRIFSMK